jgi:hypothetical protein
MSFKSFIPLRFISEIMGYSLIWQQEINTITVNQQDDVFHQNLDMPRTMLRCAIEKFYPQLESNF